MSYGARFPSANESAALLVSAVANGLVPTICRLTLVLLVRMPMFQVSVPLVLVQLPALAVAETKENAAGIVSVTTVEETMDGPSLVTSSV